MVSAVRRAVEVIEVSQDDHVESVIDQLMCLSLNHLRLCLAVIAARSVGWSSEQVQADDRNLFSVDIEFSEIVLRNALGCSSAGGKQFFRYAQRKKLVDANPFAELQVGRQHNESRQAFVRRATIDRVIKACPNAEWRLIVALARYGGLRCPSEVLNLRWCDIDWEGKRFTVTSPKTKKQGKAYRVVPLFPELEPVAQDHPQGRR